MYKSETIAAISTPLGYGGIGIIRISGKDAVGLADGIFHATKTVRDMESHTIQYGIIKDPENGRRLDEVMLTKMLAPSTYTREDVIEINCHGNIMVQRSILSLLYRIGIRPAQPGEFTKRAFLNGRIDLSQAEAVIDIINSKTERSQEAAQAQLSGRISGYINSIIEELLTVMARIEVTVDYPEHDDETAVALIAEEEIEDIIGELKKAKDSYNTGKLIRSGIQTVITGKPNAGKSTLLNELSGYERAIVTDIPGTTRDVIEEEISINGILLILKDTAGIRHTEDIVERIGVNKAKESVNNADLIIYVVSLSEEESVDMEFLKDISHKKLIILLNKEDIAQENKIENVCEQIKEYMNKDNIKILSASLSDKNGVEKVKDSIKELFMEGQLASNSEIIITAERHSDLINKSINSLEDALTGLKSYMPLDMLSIDIRNAADYLGEIAGKNISEDLVDKIFSDFCLGK